MKLQWNHSLRMTLCAVAVMGASWAHAQNQAAPISAQQPAPAVSSPASHPDGVHKHLGKKHDKHPKHHHKRHDRHGKHAKPMPHGAHSAAAGVHPHGKPAVEPGTEYERNALKRCDIFKTPDDRKACVERVRQPQISGSVEGGGWIREYTQTVRVPPANGAPAAPHPHMVHPPVDPIRK